MNKKIKKDGDNYTIDYIKWHQGKRIHIYKKGFLSLESAEAELPIITLRRIKGNDFKSGRAFDGFISSYIGHRSIKLAKSTALTIDAIKNGYLKPYLSWDTTDFFISSNIMLLHQNLAQNRNISDKWKNRIISEIRMMCEYAFMLKYITSDACLEDKNILENVKVKRRKEKINHYTQRQLRKFLSVIDDEDDKDMFILFSYLGARLSEFIGLTWDCFDEKNGAIEIKQQVIYLKEGKPVLTDSLKTKESYRTCKLNDKTIEILKRRKERSNAGFIFPKSLNKSNCPLPKTTFRLKMEFYIKKANLPRITAHGFRHTKATILMGVCLSMADVKAAAKFLGHSTTMMMETYAHEEKKNTQALIKRLESLDL